MPVGNKPKRETASERRKRRLKMTGSEYKKTGTNRTVGSVVMTVTPNPNKRAPQSKKAKRPTSAQKYGKR